MTVDEAVTKDLIQGINKAIKHGQADRAEMLRRALLEHRRQGLREMAETMGINPGVMDDDET